MRTARSHTLILIDPQNDFCDIPGASLPVAGAAADMGRVAAFLNVAGDRLTDVLITLDSHPTVAIERTPFWVTEDGAQVAPFTPITARAVRAGEFSPRNAAHRPQVLEYLDQLEAAGRYTLMVWPVHCVVGTWGHAMEARVGAAVGAWERTCGRNAHKVLKGQHPLTEQYSALKAEVPRLDDPSTQLNRKLLHAARSGSGNLYVAGEALSHCVAATVTDLLAEMTAAERSRVVLLTDCMSPVPGFDTDFLARATQAGAQLATSTQAALELAQL